MNGSLRRPGFVALFVLVAVLLSGCGFRGLNGYVLPGSKGGGDAGYVFTVELETVASLVPNAEVKVDDVTVGTVRKITLDGWHALVEVSVLNGVHLGSATQARIAQKSLLGAEYLELTSAEGKAGSREIRDGDTIPLARSGRYPETEEVLSAVSTLLNGGGIANLSVIVKEVNTALDGNTTRAKNLVGDVGTLLDGIRSQKRELVGLVDAVDRLAGRLATQTSTIGTSLDSVARGINTLDEQRGRLTGALASLDRLSRLGSQVVARDGANTRADLRQLRTALAALDDAGAGLPGSLDLIGTVLFPISGVPYVTKGDYLNFSATLDLSVQALGKGFFPGLSDNDAMAAILNALGLGGPSAGIDPPATPASPKPGTKPGAKPGSGLDGLLGGLLPTSPKPGGNGLADLLGQLLGGR